MVNFTTEEFDGMTSAKKLSTATERNEYIERCAREDFRQDIRHAEQPMLEALQNQNRLLQQQIEAAQKESVDAKEEAKKATRFTWISFAVSTLISLLALVVSVVSMFE